MVFNNRRAASAVLTWLFVASAALAEQPAGKKPAFFGFAFNYKKGQPEMRLGVCAVLDGTPAAAAGVRLDDLITAVDGKNSFKNALEVLEYVSQRRAGDELRLEILRNDQRLTIKIVAAEATEQQQAGVKRNLELAKQEAARRPGREMMLPNPLPQRPRTAPLRSPLSFATLGRTRDSQEAG